MNQVFRKLAGASYVPCLSWGRNEGLVMETKYELVILKVDGQWVIGGERSFPCRRSGGHESRGSDDSAHNSGPLLHRFPASPCGQSHSSMVWPRQHGVCSQTLSCRGVERCILRAHWGLLHSEPAVGIARPGVPTVVNAVSLGPWVIGRLPRPQLTLLWLASHEPLLEI